ncbi:MAG: decaprenyl-phosphate phosphoribosyltransferase [Acidimicrobiales bacterium]
MSKVLPPKLEAAAGSRPRPMPVVVGLLRTARPKQWSKNVLVFAAPGAAGVLTHATALGRTLLAFVVFCVVASGTYFLNDSTDAEADRQHPTKRRRPIAAGVISVRAGFTVGVVLLAAGVAGAAFLSWRLALVMVVYVAVQFAYSFYLKHQPIYDLGAVAAGFVLRAIAGGVAARVPVSEWFLIVATFGSLLMVTGKRVAEHADLGQGRGAHRATLDAYSSTFLRTVLAISAGGAIVGYCLWAFSLQTALLHHHDPIWYQLSIVPMMLALLRYTFLVESGKGAKPEELAFSDRSLQILGLVWAILFALGVYAS